MKKNKRERGITLLALVITIIIMLILAGVSIYLVISPEGILSYTEKATAIYNRASAKEELEMQIMDWNMEKIDKEKRQAQLAEIGEIANEKTIVQKQGDNVAINEYGFATIIKNGNTFWVDEFLTIIEKVEKKVQNFGYVGDVQEFEALIDGYYQIECWGAGNRKESSKEKGGYTKGRIKLKRGTKLYLYVGESEVTAYEKALPLRQSYSTFNGGGKGIFYNNYYRTASGSGASDVRLLAGNWNDKESLKSRIMVAGGAGGGEILTTIPGGARRRISRYSRK